MEKQTTYPISEIFHSVQGEGRWTGTSMCFVRLAGCTVGKPYSKEERRSLGLEIYQERCTDWSGASFACDTNYRVARRMTIDEIVAEALHGHTGSIEPKHVCITGGEPLMHPIAPLIRNFIQSSIEVHIETSGTIDILSVFLPNDPVRYDPWLCVSPKYNYLESMLERADEIKVLVGYEFDEEKFLSNFGKHLDKVFLQPVNELNTLDPLTVKKVVSLQKKYPQCGISVQLHKILQMR